MKKLKKAIVIIVIILLVGLVAKITDVEPTIEQCQFNYRHAHPDYINEICK